MPRPPTTRSCASARASPWRSSPTRRTISRSRPATISGSPRRWRVSCGDRDSLPDRRGSDGRAPSGARASRAGRADRLSDGDGVRPGLTGAGPGGVGGGTPQGPAAGQAVPVAGRRPGYGGGAGPRVQRVGERTGARLLAGAAHAGTPRGDWGRGADARRAATRRGTARSVTEEPNTKRILLVCTGNICRSPLAAALLERALVERGIEGIAVASAGTGAWDGAPVSEGAYLVGLERGLDLSGHRARLLTRELVDGADLILTMARHHRARVDELGGEGHVFVLGEYAGREGDEAEVSDPFGGDLDVYRDTCVELEALLQTAVERIVKEFASGSQR